METTLKAKAAKMWADRINRALGAIHAGEIALLADDSVRNGGGKIYTLAANGRCSCPDSTGHVAKMNAELAANGLPARLMCKHDVCRELANGRTFGVQNRRIRLKDAVLQNAVQPVAVPKWTPADAARFAANVQADFAP